MAANFHNRGPIVELDVVTPSLNFVLIEIRGVNYPITSDSVMNKNEKKVEVVRKENVSFDQFRECLVRVGSLLPVPLEQRVNLNAYAEKLYTFAEIFFAKVDHELVGLICIYMNDFQSRVAYLSMIGVDIRYQHRGIGDHLIQYGMQELVKQNMNFVHLEYHRLNYAATRFYKKHGFVVVGTKGTDSFRAVCSLKAERVPFIPVTSGTFTLKDMDEFQVDLRIKRDDLYASMVGSGGSKARKAPYIIGSAAINGYDAVVTNGGIHSNHARAIALYAARHGLRCHLVLHHDTSGIPNGDNLRMMCFSGATIEYCHNSELGPAMDAAMKKIQAEGFRPFYIWGGGHCPQGTMAYVDASEEFLRQSSDWIPDYVIVPSGTGTTQAGLTYGFAERGIHVIGISVARNRERGTQVIEKAIDDFCQSFSLPSRKCAVDFRDDWLCGGYECYDERILTMIRHMGKKGLLLDPTYTGKAFIGLYELVKQGKISKGAKILFWHTGGLFNLLNVPRDASQKLFEECE